jgi:hypothetical protein
MALPLSVALDGAFTNIQTKASQVKSASTALKAKMESGPTEAREIINYAAALKKAYDVIQTNKSATGLNDYAATELSSPALDYVVEVTAVQTAMSDCYAWVSTNLPKDASGYLLIEKFVNGTIEPRTVTSAQTAGLSALIATLLTKFA